MTNELEKQFFETFGIEPKLVISLEDWENCKDLPRAEELFKHYPQITDRILLQLTCIDSDEEPNIEWLKQCVLENLIHRYEKDLFCNTELAKHQVQALFEEG